LLAVLLLVAAAVAAWFHLDPHPYKSRAREILVAGLRAAVQLAVVSVVIAWAVKSVLGLLAFLLVCLGFGLLPQYAYAGYPAVITMALLVPVVVCWASTGVNGHLRSRGVLRAACLGAACAAQQLAWFLAPFLLIGLYAVRRGELGPRRALAVTARYTACRPRLGRGQRLLRRPELLRVAARDPASH
jgi:hypothetical protein